MVRSLGELAIALARRLQPVRIPDYYAHRPVASIVCKLFRCMVVESVSGTCTFAPGVGRLNHGHAFLHMFLVARIAVILLQGRAMVLLAR